MIYTCDSHITNLMIHSDTFGKNYYKTLKTLWNMEKGF